MTVSSIQPYTSAATINLHRIVNESNAWFGEATGNTWRYRDKPTAASWKDAGGANVAYMSQASSATAELGGLAAGSPLYTAIDVDVTGSLSAWAASATGGNKNMGWAMWLDSAIGPISLGSPSHFYDTTSLVHRPMLLVHVIPEPAVLPLIAGAGLLGLLVRGRLPR